jgi:hypothetical protein
MSPLAAGGFTGPGAAASGAGAGAGPGAGVGRGALGYLGWLAQPASTRSETARESERRAIESNLVTPDSGLNAEWVAGHGQGARRIAIFSCAHNRSGRGVMGLLMKPAIVLLVAATALTGCQKATEGLGSAGGPRGRYLGVGHFAPGPMWSQLAAPAPKTPSAARLADDEQVIVVIDSQTGEVRQCGNLSGFCIGMKPWAAALPAAQLAPAQVAKHAAELDAALQAPATQIPPTR